MFPPRLAGWLVAVAVTLTVPMARAEYVANVSMDTSALQANPGQGPYSIDIQLNDGSGANGDGNNTATISQFTVNGGSLVSPPSLFGGASGDLATTATITDSSFINELTEQFIPGSQLSFHLYLTTNVSAAEATPPGAPDEFSFTILNGQGESLASSANLSFLTIDITGPSPTVSTAGGSVNGDAIPAPTVQPVPEPSSLALVVCSVGMLGAAALRRWRRG